LATQLTAINLNTTTYSPRFHGGPGPDAGADPTPTGSSSGLSPCSASMSAPPPPPSTRTVGGAAHPAVRGDRARVRGKWRRQGAAVRPRPLHRFEDAVGSGNTHTTTTSSSGGGGSSSVQGFSWITVKWIYQTSVQTKPSPMARGFVIVQLYVCGLLCCPFSHGIDTVCYSTGQCEEQLD
jgi:hypothetical protein